MKKIWRKIKNHTYSIWSVSLLVLVCAALSAILLARMNPAETVSSQEAAAEIADRIVRFHILANSDSEEDQAVKLKVKDAVISYVQKDGGDFGSVSEAKQYLESHTVQILEIAEAVLAENGFSYGASAELTTCYFPIKMYGDAIFPAGYYEAYRILLGEGKGQNWWCVMYPALCFLDTSTGFLPDYAKENLKQIVGAKSFSVICPEPEEETQKMPDTEIKFRFRYLTFLNWLFD